METVAENEAITDEEKLERLKKAKLGCWYDEWQPYCLMCATMARMTKMPYGFQCGTCQNMIGWNLTRLAESPLNKITGLYK